jgi:hypothetical protein
MRRMCGYTGGCWTRQVSLPDVRRPRRSDQIARGHDGTNNGRLGLSIRRASEGCNVARGTALRAFVELQEYGFIDGMTKGGFSRKALHATEWRLTWWTCDVTGDLPSKTFMSWGREKQNAVSKYPVVGKLLHCASNQLRPL